MQWGAAEQTRATSTGAVNIDVAGQDLVHAELTEDTSRSGSHRDVQE